MQKWWVQGGPQEKTNGGIYYREILPFRHCAKILQEREIEVSIGGKLDPDLGYDAYFFMRTLSLAYLSCVIELKRMGKMIIWDMDDDLLNVPDFMSKKDDAQGRELVKLEMNSLNICLGLADVITTINPILAETIKRGEKTMVCPNLIDLNDHPGLPKTNTARILVTGSDSHREDLMLVKYLYEDTKKDFDWVFYGHGPEWLTDEATYIPWTRTNDYPKILRMINPRWSLCPLRNSEFNKSKSPIKVWETGMLGGSVLASNWGPYEGHPAAIGEPDEPFSRDWLDRDNNMACQIAAAEQSWQFNAEGREAWEVLFGYIADSIAA